MTNDEFAIGVSKLSNNYIENICAEVHAFHVAWKLDLSQNEMHEVINGMLARQATLAVYFARSPARWNPHMGPVVLRSMADNYISLAWICKDPLERSQKFILYGLGQEKLMIEHRKAQLAQEGHDPDKDVGIKAMEQWVNAQRFTFLLKVNIGSWSGLSTREMAQEADCIDFYRHVYEPFSATAHNTWQHISRYNLAICQNPMHRFHKVPIIPMDDADISFFILAAKYAEKFLNLCKAKFGVDAAPVISYQKLLADKHELFDNAGGTATPPVSSNTSDSSPS